MSIDLMGKLKSTSASKAPTLSAAKTPSTAARRSPKRRKPTERQITMSVGAVVSTANQGLLQFGTIPEQDSLTDQEVGMLARGIALEILDSERMLAYYMKVTSMSGGKHSVLAAACVAITIPRLIAHGFIPQEVGTPVMLIALHVATRDGGAGSDVFEQSSVPDERGRAHHSNGGNGVGQVHAGPSPVSQTPVPSFSKDQTGRLQLVNGPDSEDGQISLREHEGPTSGPNRDLS